MPQPAWTMPAFSERRLYVPGELLVKFRPVASKGRTDALMRTASVRFSRGYRNVPGLVRLSLSPAMSVTAARAVFEASPDVEYAEPNYYVHPHVIPNDQWFSSQFNLHTLGNQDVPPDTDIDAPEAWDITTGSQDIVVALLDTGLFPLHEDLAANVFRNEIECDADGVDDDANGYVDDCNGIDAYGDDSDPTDITIHGTHVAGIIGAVGNNSIGVAGVAWNVKILPCRFIDFFNGGTLADAVQCFDYVAAMKDRGFNIVATNNSWGSLYGSRVLDDAIRAQEARGILTVASAGNDGLNNDREPQYPCSIDRPSVVCVGSTSFYHRRSTFSNYGVTTMHLSAPGEDVYSTTSSSGTVSLYDLASGTSMAAPAVTGAVVLLAAQDPTRDWITIRNLLLAGVDFLDETPRRSITSGRLNLPGSMQCSNRTLTRRLRPSFRNHHLAPGVAMPLRAININCEFPNGNIVVNASPSGESIVLADNGSGDDQVAGDGVYSGRWTAPASGDYQLRFQDPIGDTIDVHVDPFLKAGFPLTGMESGWYIGFWDSPAHQVLVGNIDADPEQEIVYASVSSGPLFAWNHDGRPLPGWPIDDYDGMPYVALGEFDGITAWSEIANNRLYAWGIRLYTGDTQEMPGWPNAGFMLMPPATADLDGDGLDEIIAYPARRADGSIFNAATEVPVFGPRVGGPGLPASVAVGDLDFDGRPDMVASRDIGVWASSPDDIIEGFPASFPPGSELQSPQVFPAIGDVDGDGSPEIVVTTSSVAGDLTGRVHIFSNRGVHERMVTIALEEWTSLAPVLADLDGDGIPEILVQTAKTLHAWKGNGTPQPGWPVFLGADAQSGLATPVVGDINGDGLPDVMTTAADTSAPFAGRIYIYHRDGRPHDGYPRALLSRRMGMASAIADLDLDGRNELIVAPSSVPGTSASLYAYDYNGGNPSGPIEWGQFMEGPHNRGYYELGKNLPNHAYISVQSHGHGTVTADGGAIDCGSDCVERIAKGTQLTLRANALPGAEFAEWVGDCAGQGNPCQLMVNGPTRLAANFRSPLAVNITGTGTGRVTSSPAGISCTANCSELFDARTIVTLTATPDAGDGFDGWSGACTNTTGTCRVYMDAAKSVTALFVAERRLTITKTGTGGGTVTSSPAGLNCGPTCAADFLPEAIVQLTPVASSDSQFRRWGGDCEQFTVPCTVAMDRVKNVTAVFDLKPLVTVTAMGGGRVTSSPGGIICGAACAARFPFSEIVTLTATPDTGAAFVSWGGDCATTGTHTTCVLHFLDGPRNVSATFTGMPTLTVVAAGGGSGRVTSNPGGVDCSTLCTANFATGTVVQLTAIAGSGSAFRGWSDGCSGTQATCSVTMNASHSVMATFDSTGPPPPPPPPPGGGSGGGGGGGGGAAGWLVLIGLGVLAFRPRNASPPAGRCRLRTSNRA